jgi:hypothetical protein
LIFTTHSSNVCANLKLMLEIQKLLSGLQFLRLGKQAAANSVRPGAKDCRVATHTFLLDLQALAHQISKIF